jgi:hypothetical protein
VISPAFILSIVMVGFCLQHDLHAQEEGLVAYWNFDEGKGSVIRDASGNGHDGLVKDAGWVSGKVNHALSFEKGGFVEIPDHQDLRLKDDFGNFSQHLIHTGVESHLGARLFNLDGDGDLDIVNIGYADWQYLYIWRNDGVGY